MKKTLLTTAVLIASLAQAPLALAQNLAVVNGVAVPTSRINAILDQAKEEGKPIPDAAKEQIKKKVIELEIISQEAKRRNLEGSDAYKAQMAIAQQQVLQQLLAEQVMKQNKVSEADAKAEYDRVATQSGQEYKVRHILVEDEKKANDLLAQLGKGGKFADLAKKNSKDPGSAANGGDLGWAVPQTFVPEFAQAMIALGKGKTTDKPVKTKYGYHIISVEDVRKSTVPPFAQIKDRLMEQMQQQKTAKFFAELIKSAKVQ